MLQWGLGVFCSVQGNLWYLEYGEEESGSHQAGFEGLNPLVWRRVMEYLDEGLEGYLHKIKCGELG